MHFGWLLGVMMYVGSSKGKVLTTGPPRKSQIYPFLSVQFENCVHCVRLCSHATVKMQKFPSPQNFFMPTLSLTLVPGNHWFDFCHYSFAFSIVSYKLDHTECSRPLRLLSFTMHFSGSMMSRYCTPFLLLCNVPRSTLELDPVSCS